MNLLWLFFMIVTLQPALQKLFLVASRRRMIAKIERQRGSRVILLVHRQETMSFLGFPVLRYIDINDSEDVLRALDLTDPDVPLDLVLHTPGGLVLASVQIARAIHRRTGKVTVVVPHYAMSGGTLIALAANEIVMSPNSVLGPVDPQLGEYPAASLQKVVKEKPIARVNDKTLILADQAEKALVQVRACVRGLLAANLSPERAEELASKLAEGGWTHDHPIGFAEARELGLPVSDQIPREFMQLLGLYPQPMRTDRSVEYLPGSYRSTPRGTARRP